MQHSVQCSALLPSRRRGAIHAITGRSICIVAGSASFCSAGLHVQVGDVSKDHNQCIRAEKDTTTPRPVVVVDMDHPGADAFAIAAAAFAAAHLALQARADRPHMAALSDKCLARAKTLYKYAGKMRMVRPDAVLNVQA